MESRLASLMLDTDDLNNVPAFVTSLPDFFNMRHIRRAIIPAANGHCSARALARYYAALADGGVVPPPHSSVSNPPLGSHPHIPNFPTKKTHKRVKGKQTNVVDAASKNKTNDCREIGYTRFVDEGSNSSSSTSTTDSTANRDGPQHENSKIFSNPRIHDAFMGVGEYWNLTLADGIFGLGFRRFKSKDGCFTGFGHPGMGGSTGFCDIKNRFAIAVTVNKMSFGGMTTKIFELVCSELNIPLPGGDAKNLL